MDGHFMKIPESDAVYELKNKILKAAFKQEKFEYPQSSEIIEMHTKLYVFNSNGKRKPLPTKCRNDIKSPEYSKGVKDVIIGLNINTISDLYDLSFKMNSFAHELSEIIWHCMEERDPEWAKKLLAEIKQSYISAAKAFSSEEGYSKADDKELSRIARNHAKKEVAKIRKTVDFNYSQSVHHWIEEDKIAINKAYLLYKQTWDGKTSVCLNKNIKLPKLSVRNIMLSLAIIFAATDFWIDKQKDSYREKKYFEKIKKHLDKIKKEIQEDRDAHEASLYDDLP